MSTGMLGSSPSHRPPDRLAGVAQRNGWALIASSAITSTLGLAYWWLAARIWPDDAVGQGAALISTMALVAELATLGLSGGLTRHLPRAGAGARGLIRAAFATGAIGAVVLAAIVVTVLRERIDELDHIGLVWMPWIIIATAAWTVFVMQDGALIGLGRATVVPIENFGYSLGKFVALIVLGAAATRTTGTLYLSWTAPALVAVVAVAILVLPRAAPPSESGTGTDRTLFGRSIRYSVADHAASMMQRSAPLLLPVTVLATLGSVATSRYFVAWSSAYALYLISSNMCQSLLAEASRSPAMADRYVGSTLDHTVAATIIGSSVAVAVAPVYLGLFGPGYADDATTLFRLLALGAIPNAITTVYLGVLRVRGRLGQVALIQAMLGIPVLVAAPFVLDRSGLDGLGVMWLAVQCVVAVIVVVTGWWDVWAPSISVRAIRAARLAAGAGLAPFRRSRPAEGEALTDRNGVRVVRAADRHGATIVKEATDQRGVERLRREAAHLNALRARDGLAVIGDVMPEVIALEPADGAARLRLTELAGTNVDHLDEIVRHDLFARMRVLWATSSRSIEIDQRVLRRWVDERVEVVRSALGHDSDEARGLDRLAEGLRTELRGRVASVSWIHGDLSPANVLVDAPSGVVSGIIDWELAAPDELPEVDAAQFLLASRCARAQAEIGHVAVEVLERGWEPWEAAALADAGSLQRDAVPWRTVVVLTWLRHVAANLTKADAYGRHRVWMVRNVTPMMRWLGASAP